MEDIASKRLISVFLLSGFCALLGVFIIFLGPIIGNFIISSQLEFTPTSAYFKVWKNIPISVKTNFYFFNWTNPEDIRTPGIKPKFKELGPYTYKSTIHFENVTWNDNNGTISYKQIFTWYLDENSSNPVTDSITSINPIALSSAHVTRYWSYLLKKGLSFALSASAPVSYTTKTVNELLFEGYDDFLVNIARNLPMLKEMPKMDKMAWFRVKNGSRTYNNYFNMGTGRKGTEAGRLYNWNYKSDIPFLGSECSKIESFTGQLPHIDSDNSYSIFYSDFCKTLVLDYVGDEHISNILGKRYSLSKRSLDNGTLYPENSCFCNGECLPSGVINTSSCGYGSPVFGSLPHFLNADPYYVDSIEGMNPDPSKHQFELTLEPTYGLSLRFSVRVQVNSLVQSYPGIKLFENVPKIMMPIFWAEEIIEMPEYGFFVLRIILNLPKICFIIGSCFVCFGIIWMLIHILRIHREAIIVKKIEKWSDLDQVKTLQGQTEISIRALDKFL